MKPPKVLDINFSDGLGGSARSSYRIYQGLQGMGYDLSMLVEHKTTQDVNVDLFRKPIWRFIDFPFQDLLEQLDLQYLFFPSSFRLYGTVGYVMLMLFSYIIYMEIISVTRYYLS